MTTPAQFRRLVWAHYRKHGRHELPWRKTRNPYKILVSEVMLQQTQVDRVKPFYASFLKKFPTAKKLAGAPLSEVLKAWQGLGYNRRAKMLHAAAKELASTAWISPRSNLGRSDVAEELEKLPGVGRYTARAVAVFAFGADEVLIETNIRTAVMHHFFPRGRKRSVGNTIIYDSVSDVQIEEALKKVSPKGKAREWNYALMDYGASLKRSGVHINKQSRHYTKQSKFSGSLREARGAIIKVLAKSSATKKRLTGLLGDDRKAQLEHALSALVREGLVARHRTRYLLAK